MSRTLTTLFVGQNSTQQIKPIRLLKDEAYKISIDWTSLLATLGSTISSSTWSTLDSGTIGVSSPTSSGGITSCLVTGSNIGNGIAKNSVVLANGETRIRDYYVIVTDPTVRRWGDYWGWDYWNA